MADRRPAAVAGAREMAPMILGVAPFGVIAGAAAVDAGFSPVLTVAMSAIVFAGASQLAIVDLVGGGAAPLVVVGTAVVVNLRYLMYSASIAPYFRSFGRAWRPVLGYLLTDQAFALSVTRYESENDLAGQGADPLERKWFYVGGAATLWTVWMATTVVGVVVGAQVPPSWSLEFAIPLTFLALLVPAIEDRSSAVAAVAAGSVATVGVELPLNLGLVVGALSGVVFGAATDHWFPAPGGDSREGTDSGAGDDTPEGGDPE
jgi:predicted branched-subunit amino acid permease